MKMFYMAYKNTTILFRHTARLNRGSKWRRLCTFSSHPAPPPPTPPTMPLSPSSSPLLLPPPPSSPHHHSPLPLILPLYEPRGAAESSSPPPLTCSLLPPSNQIFFSSFQSVILSLFDKAHRDISPMAVAFPASLLVNKLTGRTLVHINGMSCAGKTRTAACHDDASG